MAKNPVTSADHAVKLLAKAVKLKGADYVYAHPTRPLDRACAYVHGEECGCIVGCALTFNGWTLEELAPYENKNVVVIAERNGFDDNARIVLWEAQSVQDGTDYDVDTDTYSRGPSHSWGKALAAARAKAKELTRAKELTS